MRNFPALVLLVILVNGCTVVHIREGGGAVRTERHAGFLQVTLPPSSNATLAEIRSFGYYASPFGPALGFSSVRLAAVSPECRLLVWVQSDEVAALPASARAAADACVVQLTQKGKQE